MSEGELSIRVWALYNTRPRLQCEALCCGRLIEIELNYKH
jgi:hypothetical protein